MDDESKEWIYRFFSVLTKEELIDILKEFYNAANNDGCQTLYNLEDSLKWIVADHKEIEHRM